ncbi:hypothetical protein ANO11243_084430 [Dothideomycetidae sp. 11243]|nr:hypothetical protein ANO11243_084430 [fungal sp. No.11243]
MSTSTSASTSSSTSIPDGHGPSIVTNAVIGVVIATFCLGLRLYVRGVMTKSFGFDDYILIAAFISFLTLTALTIAYGITITGTGILTNLNTATLILEWHTFFYSVDQSFLKAALAAFYLRVLSSKSWQRTVVLVSTSIFIAYTMILAFVFLFQCGNPNDLASTACLNGNNLTITSYVQAGLNAFMDWLLTLLPITVIFKTQMSARTKTSVVLIMLVGAAASAISIVRIFSLNAGDSDDTAEGYATIARLIVMSYWENCIGQIAISLAALRPLIRRVFKGTKGSSYGPSAPTGATRPVTTNKMGTGIAVEHTYTVQDNAYSETEELELIDRKEMTPRAEV